MDDYHWFVKTMGRVSTEEMGEEYTAMIENTNYFVDFMR